MRILTFFHVKGNSRGNSSQGIVIEQSPLFVLSKNWLAVKLINFVWKLEYVHVS